MPALSISFSTISFLCAHCFQSNDTGLRRSFKCAGLKIQQYSRLKISNEKVLRRVLRESLAPLVTRNWHKNCFVGRVCGRSGRGPERTGPKGPSAGPGSLPE